MPQPGVVPYAYLALTVLTVINLLNYLDRFVVSAIVPDLTAPPLSFTDGQVGWLGSAFLLVYIIAAPIFGSIGDRGSRTRPMALGILVWSIATILSGLAGSYLQFLGGRALVGIGEAAYVAIAPALLADCFPADRRARVLAVLNMAIPVGSALGYVVGGLVREHWGWREVFFVAGVPGLLLALLALWLPDPPRGVQDGGEVHKRPGSAGLMANAREALKDYRGLLQRAPYLWIVLGYAANTFAIGGLAFWMPTFLQRVRGFTLAEATTNFGLTVVATGLIGTFLGGWLGDLGLRWSRQAHLWMSGWTMLLSAPLVVIALMVQDSTVFYVTLIIGQLLIFMSTGPINAALVNGVSPLERASAVGLGTLLMHLLGDVPSPTLIGRLSDAYSLGTAVLIVPVAVVLAGIAWMIAAKAHAKAHAGALGQT